MIYILSGEIETGKSKSLLRWIENRSDVSGILSPTDEDGLRYFLNILTRERFPMQASVNDQDIISIGRYHFFRRSFEKANEILSKAASENDSGYILIDELGKLEMKSEGLHNSAKKVIERTMYDEYLHAILVIRDSLLNAIKEKYEITENSFWFADLTED